MEKPVTKIFIGGALTNAPDQMFEHYAKLAELFRESGHEVYNPAEKYHEYKSENVSDHFAFTNCLANFKTCTHALMYIGQPSLGVGIELAMLHMLQVPTIAYWFAGDKVSDYALGMIEGSNNIKSFAISGFEGLICHI
jgi:hypothetical protein